MQGKTSVYWFFALYNLAPQVEEKSPSPPSLYRNPLVLAQEWQLILDSDTVGCRPDLARRRGVNSGRVEHSSQMFG